MLRKAYKDKLIQAVPRVILVEEQEREI